MTHKKRSKGPYIMYCYW